MEKGNLYIVDEHGEFLGTVDQWSDRCCVREHTLRARPFDVFVGEKIEIDGYAVPDLKSRRGA